MAPSDRTIRGLHLLLVVAALTAVGCLNDPANRDRPGGPLYRMWGASGDRIVVETAEDSPAPVAKLRRRTDGFKVYDSVFVPVGTVEVAPPKTADDASAGGSGSDRGGGIRVTTFDGRPPGRLQSDSKEVWSLGDRLRIEQTSRGWAVYDGKAEWIGRFERRDGAWVLLRGKHDEKVWRARDESNGVAVRAADVPRYRLREGSLEPAVALALALEELPLAARIAVGVWLRDFMSGAATEEGGADSNPAAEGP